MSDEQQIPEISVKDFYNRISSWITHGLYYGYSHESIVAFCFRSLCKRYGNGYDDTELKKSIFFNNCSGFLPSPDEIQQNPEDIIAQINKRRRCIVPFGINIEAEVSHDVQDKHIETLLSNDLFIAELDTVKGLVIAKCQGHFKYILNNVKVEFQGNTLCISS